jgi:hypothetical protein
MALVWWLSGRTSVDDAGSLPIPGGRLGNSFHFLTFSGLATLWATAADPAGSFGGTPGVSRRFAFGLAAAFAVVDETHQFFTPGRCCSLYDLAIDLCGAACAATARFEALPNFREAFRRSRASAAFALVGIALVWVSGGRRPPGDYAFEDLLALCFGRP